MPWALAQPDSNGVFSFVERHYFFTADAVQTTLQFVNYDGTDVSPLLDNVRFGIPGDSNLDGFVDGADYTIWADHFLVTGQNWETGDLNGDGIVDGADYTIWADHFAPAQLSLSAVPEPSTLAPTCIGALGMLIAARRRSAH